jgi:peptidoglycan hydrolase-like protein with peptidoglycan-binding domain
MIRQTTLLAAGLLLTGSTAVLAQEPATSTQPSAPSAVVAAPPAAAISDTLPPTTPVVDTVWEQSPTRRTRADVKEVQTWLAAIGLFDGSKNGSMGPDTREAIRRFQRTNGLAVTGQVSDSLMVLLRKAAAAAPSTR